MPPKGGTDGGSKEIKVPVNESNIKKKHGVGGAKVSKIKCHNLMKVFKKQLEILESVTEKLQKVLSPVCSDDEEEQKEVEEEELSFSESEQESQEIGDGECASTQTPIQF